MVDINLNAMAQVKLTRTGYETLIGILRNKRFATFQNVPSQTFR